MLVIVIVNTRYKHQDCWKIFVEKLDINTGNSDGNVIEINSDDGDNEFSIVMMEATIEVANLTNDKGNKLKEIIMVKLSNKKFKANWIEFLENLTKFHGISNGKFVNKIIIRNVMNSHPIWIQTNFLLEFI